MFASSRRAATAYRNLAVRVRQDLPSVGFDPDVCVVEPSPPDTPALESLKLWQALGYQGDEPEAEPD